jgi:hypothetical protein
MRDEHTSLTVSFFQQGVVVHFDGELGVDCGALTREWAKIMCQQLLRPGRGLFRRTARGNRVVFLADQVTTFQDLGIGV